MNTTTKKILALGLLATSMFALSGCGSGGKIVKKMKFVNEMVGANVYTGFDATMNLGKIDLPYSMIPIMHPKTGANIGFINTEPKLIGLRLDLLTLSKLPVESNAATLPNGRPLPVSLPADVIPMSIPIKGTNAKVYFALGSENIMAGVALTLKVVDTNGGGYQQYLGIPANVFFPFTIDPTLSGTAGIFTGEKFGVGVFAVKTVKSQSPPTGGTPESFGLAVQQPSSSKLYRISGAVSDVTAVKID